MFAVDLSDIAFIILRYVPSITAFWRVFIINGCWILSKAFSASIEIRFSSFNLLTWCITLIDLWILKNPCIPEIKPTWSWCMIFLICYWILFARILLRIFASMFINGIWHFYSLVCYFPRHFFKNFFTVWETWVRSLGREDPLEKETATHSIILVWRIPWTAEPGGLQSMRSQRVGHDWVTSLFL